MIREFFRWFFLITAFFVGLAALCAWVYGDGSRIVWVLRIFLTLMCAGAIGCALMVKYRRDLLPDYLYSCAGKYFDRHGFCFVVGLDEDEGVCYLHVLFQNRHERPCTARVAIKPRTTFKTIELDPLAIDIQVEAAAFGVARIAVPIPKVCQGKRCHFDVGATVKYPHGKGRTLRFRDAFVLRHDAHFKSTFGSTLMILGAIGGGIVFVRPAFTTLHIPKGVAHDLAGDVVPEVVTYWMLGEPLLDTAA